MIEALRTPGMKIPGVFLCLLFAFAPCVSADCGQAKGALFEVVRVVDGDTLRLMDGRSVRVIGVNAPEIKRGNKPGQPLGVAARAATQSFIDAAGGKVRLGYEREQTDRYGRLLAHVYNTHGRSLGHHLLRQGLVFAVAVPPNVALASCLYKAQDEARQKRLGIWGNRAWAAQPATALFVGDEGFRRVKGRVEKVDINSAVWIELEGKLVIRVARKDWQYFPQKPRDWQNLKGKTLELEGWITARQRPHKDFKPLIMQLRSPHGLRVISP
jgi:micrococcal nuclease